MFCDEHYLKDVDSESKAAARNHRINNKFAKFSICYEYIEWRKSQPLQTFISWERITIEYFTFYL